MWRWLPATADLQLLTSLCWLSATLTICVNGFQFPTFYSLGNNFSRKAFLCFKKGRCIRFLGQLEQTITNWVVLNNRCLFSDTLRHHKSETRVSAGLISSGGSVCVRLSSMLLSWLLVTAHNPWHSLTHKCIFPISASFFTRPSPPCFSVFTRLLFSLRTIVTGLNVCHKSRMSTSWQPELTIFAKTRISNKVTSMEARSC